MQFRRIQVEEVDGVTIVTFVDRKLLDEASIRELGQELFWLVDQQHCRKVVVDFAAVEFISSSALGKLFVLNKKLLAADGRLVFCNVRPEAYEVFAITKTNRLFSVMGSRNEALHWIHAYVAEVDCPLEACVGTTGYSTPDQSMTGTRTLHCMACGAKFTIFFTAPSQALVSHLELPTHENESIFYFQADQYTPAQIAVRGRLTVAVMDQLRRVWNVIPAPRAVVFDLRRMTRFRDKQFGELAELCGGVTEDGCAVIKIDPKNDQHVKASEGLEGVYGDDASARDALSTMPPAEMKPIPVTLRLARQ